MEIAGKAGGVRAPDDELARLTALVRLQRAELDRLGSQATARAVTERATGMLMERLGCTAEEAQQQLALLAAEAGMSRDDIAADIAGKALPVPARRRGARRPRRPRRPRRRPTRPRWRRRSSRRR